MWHHWSLEGSSELSWKSACWVSIMCQALAVCGNIVNMEWGHWASALRNWPSGRGHWLQITPILSHLVSSPLPALKCSPWEPASLSTCYCCPRSLRTLVAPLRVDSSALTVLFLLGKKRTVEKVYTLCKPSSLWGLEELGWSVLIEYNRKKLKPNCIFWFSDTHGLNSVTKGESRNDEDVLP